MLERGEMKMESIGGASTESEDEGELEDPLECPSPMTRVSPPEPSPPLDNQDSKDQLNIGVSIVSRLAPPITGRRPSVPSSSSSPRPTSTSTAPPQKVYYSLPNLVIIGESSSQVPNQVLKLYFFFLGSYFFSFCGI